MINLIYQNKITFSIVDLLIMLTNLFCNIFVYFLFTHVIMFVAITQISWVVIFLKQIAHLHQHLVKLTVTFSAFHLNTFFCLSTKQLVDFLADNFILGKLFFIFIIGSCPISSYFITWAVANATCMADILVPLIFVSHEMLAIFGFHYLFTKVPRQISKGAKLLNCISGRNSLHGCMYSLQTRIRLSHCIAAFHTSAQYGVISCAIGVVNLNTFAKVSKDIFLLN